MHNGGGESFLEVFESGPARARFPGALLDILGPGQFMTVRRVIVVAAKVETIAAEQGVDVISPLFSSES